MGFKLGDGQGYFFVFLTVIGAFLLGAMDLMQGGGGYMLAGAVGIVVSLIALRRWVGKDWALAARAMSTMIIFFGGGLFALAWAIIRAVVRHPWAK